MRPKYPAQKRYEQNNPTISFRVTREEKQNIGHMATREHTSVSNLVKHFLLKLDKDFSQAREESYNKGYDTGYQKGQEEGHNSGYTKGKEDGYDLGSLKGYIKGNKDWAIWINCAKCGNPVQVVPNSDVHKRVIERMEGQAYHDECPK